MAADALVDQVGERCLGLFDAVEHAQQVVDEQCCGGRGRLHTGVGHHVEDAFVAVVADAGDDGQGELGDVLGQCQRVEAAEVGSGTAASDDDDAVEPFGSTGVRGYGSTRNVCSRGIFAPSYLRTPVPPINLVESINDALLHLFALHDGGEEGDGETEAVGVVLQLAAEVAVAGGIGCADDGDVLCEEWQSELALQVEYAFVLQLVDNLLTLTGHVAEGIGGVDVADYPREAIGFVKLGIDAQQYLHAGVQRLAGGTFEVGFHHEPRLSPAFG